ncbi:MAG: DUF2065 domain-containing protein [Rhodospirillales bacterium]|jgi:uncharacterized protein
MSDLVTALGLALALEGILYALFPDAMRKMLAQLLSQPPTIVRTSGLLAAAVGVVIVWLVRG